MVLLEHTRVNSYAFEYFKNTEKVHLENYKCTKGQRFFLFFFILNYVSMYVMYMMYAYHMMYVVHDVYLKAKG